MDTDIELDGPDLITPDDTAPVDDHAEPDDAGHDEEDQ